MFARRGRPPDVPLLALRQRVVEGDDHYGSRIHPVILVGAAMPAGHAVSRPFSISGDDGRFVKRPYYAFALKT